MYEYRVSIDRVVDGDTVDCWIDLGYNLQIHKRIRFAGVNAPETRTRNKEEKKRGLAAKKWLIDRLEDQDVEMKSYGSGKYGRILGELYIDDVNINADMVEKGHAVKYDGGKR